MAQLTVGLAVRQLIDARRTGLRSVLTTLSFTRFTARDQTHLRFFGFSACHSCQFTPLGLYGQMPTNLYDAVVFALSLTTWVPGY